MQQLDLLAMPTPSPSKLFFSFETHSGLTPTGGLVGAVLLFSHGNFNFLTENYFFMKFFCLDRNSFLFYGFFSSSG
jgi:hypothetical protein